MINPNAVLEINSKNLIKNYKTISKYSNKSLTGAVIKANAYGLGDIEIYKKLYNAGCRNYFLATLNEAINIKINKPVKLLFLKASRQDFELEILDIFN